MWRCHLVRAVIRTVLIMSCARAIVLSKRAAPSRRDALSGCGAAAAFAILPANALIQAPICTSGVGDGCDALSADSPLLKELQEKSAAKRDQRAKEALERYNINNFGDYFSATFPPKALVRHRDGTFEALTQDVVAAGLKSGRIRYGGTLNAGVAGYSTSRAPFEFADEEPSPPPATEKPAEKVGD
mmetsp:Transcript_10697/g.31898  ORF Transcript_10697/g.31898 Transcript_10697/m.31898 type:complete len:186 (+) Transcript_10697:118-675(+)